MDRSTESHLLGFITLVKFVPALDSGVLDHLKLSLALPKCISALFVHNENIVIVGVFLGRQDFYPLDVAIEAMFGVVPYSIGGVLIEFKSIVVGHA